MKNNNKASSADKALIDFRAADKKEVSVELQPLPPHKIKVVNGNQVLGCIFKPILWRKWSEFEGTSFQMPSNISYFKLACAQKEKILGQGKAMNMQHPSV